MKDSYEKNKNDKLYKQYLLKKIGMTIQTVFVLCLVLFGVLSIFNSKMLKFLNLSLGLSLLSMAYNNYIIYKRKLFTLIYLIVGIIVLIAAIWG